jgi:hypothetical protein
VNRRHDCVGNIPIFVAGVEIETVAYFGIVFEWCGNFREDAALLIVPAKKGRPIQAVAIEVVKFREDSFVGQTAQYGDGSLPLLAGPCVPFGSRIFQIEGAVGAAIEVEMQTGKKIEAFELGLRG